MKTEAQSPFDRLLEKALEENVALSLPEIARLLRAAEGEEETKLFQSAYQMKTRHVGRVVRLRGIVELGNVCSKDCFYCGIRRSNAKMHRYTMSEEEIVETALLGELFHYGSVVLQGGERSDAAFVDLIEGALQKIRNRSEGRLGITLSLGEQTPETYRRWFAAGAHRYLLRIESSSPELYARIHPSDHSYAKRRRALDDIRAAGFQVGTGVMSCLPGQTIEDLARDIAFFRDLDCDMIGMGPYIPHRDTPLGQLAESNLLTDSERLSAGLRMIAVTRLVLRDVNIASTTALQALAPDGRERGLLAGGNVVMPNLSAVSHRGDYLLYQNKPGTDENAGESRQALLASVERIGECIEPDAWGDSPHFGRRKGRQ
ncbi:MAG: [FeFe] hydrogenase H-cluster radical SAM maturase HydE [Victivallaceae bacterium]|nr:[FeFe] hydrogenase H-cluster radical SAM maturase HydE [Victivallaceae bacterium]